MEYYGSAAIVKLISTFGFVYLAFWSLQALNLQKIFKKGQINQIRILYLFLSVALGYLANEFFFSIITLTRNIIIPLR